MNLGYTTTHVGTSCGCGGPSNGSACDPRRIKSISRVGDNAIVAFDDCTYMEAPVAVVDPKSFGNCADNALPSEVMEKLRKLEAGLTALESKVEKGIGFDPTELLARIEALEDFKDSVLNNLVDIRNAHNEVTHRAFNKNFNKEEN